MHVVDENDRRTASLLAGLRGAAIRGPTGAHWEEEQYDRWALNTNTRSTAIILDAIATIEPGGRLAQQAVRWLMSARRRGGDWPTTQETAWALIAFSDWLAATGDTRGQYDYALALNGTTLSEGTVTRSDIYPVIRHHVDVAELRTDRANLLTLERGPGPGRLYYSAQLEVFLPVEDIEPLDRGIILTRRFCALTLVAPREGDKRLPCQPLTEARVGDEVEVRITLIAPRDLHFLAVEDPLPAGAEAVDLSLTASQAAREPGLRRAPSIADYHGRYRWWRRWYWHTEIRDDRVVLFAENLPAGTYEYTYTFRAMSPGDYRVIPTTAHELYHPEVFGRASGMIFTVTE